MSTEGLNTTADLDDIECAHDEHKSNAVAPGSEGTQIPVSIIAIMPHWRRETMGKNTRLYFVVGCNLDV